MTGIIQKQTNFLTILNLFIMRKSIFLTVILALWSVLTFGQGTADTEVTPAKPSDCTENENFPAIGVPHTYEVNVSGGSYSGGGTYNWYVTQNADALLDKSGSNVVGQGGNDNTNHFEVVSGTGFSEYNSVVNTKNKIKLKWHTKALLDSGNKPFFLVLNYKEDISGGCSGMNNVKVMKIEPLNQFKLEMIAYDLANTQDFAGGAGTDCAGDVQSATYDANTNRIRYNMGTQTLYYKVTAKGFVGKWLPQFKLPALKGSGTEGQSYASAKMFAMKTDGSKGDQIENDALLSVTAGKGNTASQTIEASNPIDIGNDGSSGGLATTTSTYLLEVVINNNTYETLADQDLSTNATDRVAVDGTYGGTNNKGLNDQADNCAGDENAWKDDGKYTITARPTVTATSGGFIQRVQ